MVIVQIQGGLGNQMFQYALGLQLQYMGRDVRYDYRAYEGEPDPSKQYYLPIFGIKCPQASEEELRRLGQGRSLVSRIGMRLGIFGRSAGEIKAGESLVARKALRGGAAEGIEGMCQESPGSGLCRVGGRYDEDLSAGYQPQILGMDDVYLSGYWQSERYFAGHREEVMGQFRFPDPAAVSQENARLLDRIHRTCAVSVHIRRGDYLEQKNVLVHGGICTPEYYQRAMDYVRSVLPSPVFYVFSDDPEWVREHYQGPDIVAVPGNTTENAWVDMYLMTQCRANIVANSSFSWWGAWLNPAPEKLVISPSRWLANYDVHDAICEDWVTIG